jgi:hypothetical protein
MRPYLKKKKKKPFHKKRGGGLVEWLKVKSLSLNSVPQKIKDKENYHFVHLE